jgi:hypothetical protein
VESVSHVNIVKKIKIDGDWKLLSIPRNAKGNYDWNALPEGLYLIEWRAGGKRRRESAGVTAAQALEAQRRKRHELEGRKLGVPGFELAGEPDHLMDNECGTPRIAEQAIGDLITAFEAHVPAILQQFADLLGRNGPRVSVQERRRLMASLRRKLRRLWSVFVDLEALGATPESSQRTESVKAALRSILIEMVAPPRIRKSPDAGRLEWLIAMVAKATNPPRTAWARQAAYLEARTHLWNVLISVYSKVPLSAVHAVLESWADGGEYRRYVHSLRLLGAAAAHFRSRATRQISDRAAVELQNEYLRSANLFEQQLRLLTGLVRRTAGVKKPWSYWQQQNLKDLMEMASQHAALGEFVPFIDRNVRNALTHGPPGARAWRTALPVLG